MRHRLSGIVDNDAVVRCAGTTVMVMVGDLLKVQGRVPMVTVLYQKALGSDSQALKGKADEQQNEQEQAAHPTSLPELRRLAGPALA